MRLANIAPKEMTRDRFHAGPGRIRILDMHTICRVVQIVWLRIVAPMHIIGLHAAGHGDVVAFLGEIREIQPIVFRVRRISNMKTHLVQSLQFGQAY